MTFDDYQKQSRDTAIYPKIGERYVYPALGLVNEAGEVAGKVKKIFRDEEGVVTEEKREDIKKELGDVLWYLAQIATEFDLSLKDIAAHNLEKLQSRKARGTIGGSGDNR
ncbi:MAG: nucleoside triphosphate pyrophosphohydrolase family protein [Parcubacteria group bacterium]|nr:nucleoside triphosphate pyrophosphohydrolase family protein [Parcubacteria group bacterium]